MAEVRINEVTADIAVADATAFLGPEVLERIVQAVLARLADHERLRAQLEREQRIGEGG
jgi:hypothetical protein